MKKLFASLFNTNDSYANLILRIILGSVFFPHGAQKLLGWFGGYGFTASMNFFTTGAQLPWILAFLIIMTESIGSLVLIIGFFSRIAALGMTSLMLGAISLVHYKQGFFMNWFGTKKGEGFEYHLLALGISLAILISGAGKFSIDRFIHKKISTY
jgi:putative oxidoreductase